MPTKLLPIFFAVYLVAAETGQHAVTLPDAIQWKAVGPGFSMSVLSGDPQAEGSPFVIRYKLAGGVRIAPHWHPVDEHLTVITGVFFMGIGDAMDEEKAQPMAAGSYCFVPKEMRHFAFAKAETVVQIHGIGPFKTLWVQGARVELPSGYRQWAVAKTLVVGPQSKLFSTRGGIHHYYANPQAVEGYRTGNFPDGSVIVDEGMLTTYTEGITVETEVRSLDVMVKDSRVHRATGGWGFEHFNGSGSSEGAGAEVRAACFSCHSGSKERDYVFSSFRK